MTPRQLCVVFASGLMLAAGPPMPAPAKTPCFRASAWPAADELFRRSPYWLGADVASSVSLADGRTLWLFGDTWIDASGAGARRNGRMVSNSVAIQRGTDPAEASIAFFWGRDADDGPAALFPDRNGESLWLGHGVQVEDRLVLFFARTRRNTGTGLGFEHAGWTAVLVENPQDEPLIWRWRELQSPVNSLGVLFGFGAAIRHGDYVYAFGSADPVRAKSVYAMRWPVDNVHRSDLSRPEVWSGEKLGWEPDAPESQWQPLFDDGQSELSIHENRDSGQFMAVQTVGFGAAEVAIRVAPDLAGPWSAPGTIYRPPEYDRPDVMIYAAKAHPQLTGADIVLTYVTNTFVFAEQLSDERIYYPRFIRLDHCLSGITK